MKVEVLASVMNASLRETVQHMNLQSDAVIINQCDRFGQEEMQISQETERHESSASTVSRTGASEGAGMRLFCGQKEISAFFRMQILCMRTDMKRRSWQNLRKIRRQT